MSALRPWIYLAAVVISIAGIGLQAAMGAWYFAIAQAAIAALLAYVYGLVQGRQQGRTIGHALGQLQTRVDRDDFDYLRAQLDDEREDE